MSEAKKKCTYCGKDLPERLSYVNFTNVEQSSPYLFCGQKCKKLWISERINKSQIDGVEWSRESTITKNPKPILDKAE